MSYCALDFAGNPIRDFAWTSDPSTWIGPFAWNQAVQNIETSLLARTALAALTCQLERRTSPAFRILR